MLEWSEMAWDAMTYLASLQEPHTFGEETCSDKVQEAGRYNEKDLQGGAVSSLVDEVADDCACKQTTEHGKGKGVCWIAQSHAT